MAMSGFLRQSTAATLKLGPFVDATDGNTEETALTITQADVRVSKNGGNYAQKNDATSATHNELGEYDCPIDATDTNTVGRLRVAVHEAGALIVVQDYQVLEEAVYDRDYAAAATGLVTLAAVTHTGAVIPTVTTTATATAVTTVNGLAANVITATSINADAITAAKVAADVGTEIGTAVWATTTRLLTAGTNIALAKGTGVTGFNDLSAAQVNAEVDTALADYDGPTNTEMVARTLVSADYGTAANQITILTNQGTLNTAIGTVDTVVDGIAVQTTRVDGLIEDSTGDRFTAKALEEAPSGGGGGPTAAEIADAVWDEAQSGHVGVGTFGEVATEVAAILVDTAEIGAAGAGLAAVPWNAAWDAEVQSEVTDALNAYDPPTNAEMVARTLAAASYATATDLATVASDVDAILDDTGTNGVIVATNNDKTGYAIGTGGIAATSFAAGAVDAASLSADAGAEIGAAVLTAAAASPIEANVKEINDTTLTGNGNSVAWGPA